MAFYKSKYTGAEIDQRLAQGTYDDALMRGFDGTKEDFDILLAKLKKTSDLAYGSQQYQDDRLETVNKTVVDAINELHIELQSKPNKDEVVDQGELQVFKDEIAAKYATKGELEENTTDVNSKISTLNNNLVESVNTINKNVNDSLTIVNQAIQQNAETLIAEIEQRKEADKEIKNALNNDPNFAATITNELSKKLDSDKLLAGAGINIREEDGKKIVDISEETLTKIQYVDSEVRRLETAKIPYAYDEKTQSNINVILPEGGSYLGNYGDENATIAKATVYDGVKQLELGSSKVHTNINTDSAVTIETSDGKKVIATTDQIPDISELATKEELVNKVDWVDYNNTKNIVLPSNGQVFGDFGGEESNSSLLGARIYNAGLENEEKQVEVGTSKVHLNLNSSDKPTIETPDGKENLVVESDIELIPIEVNFPVRTSGGSDGPEDRVYTQEEILEWFGVADIAALKKQIANKGIQYIKYGIMLMGNPYYYRMPIEYIAFESANQIKLVFIGLNTNNDVVSKYEIIINLDGTIIKGNSNVKVTITSIESGDIDLSEYATKEELNDYALKSELPDVFNLATVATSGDYNDLTNTPDLTVYQTITDNSLATGVKTIPAAINEIKESVDSISGPYEINLTNLLSAEDSESISTAIGGIDNLNDVVQNNRIIVGTISNGSVSVSIRILGNVTTLYYLLDSVVGLTLNEVAITNTSGTLSKSITTHSVLTENMVINSLNSDEITLPLSAAQGKSLDNKITTLQTNLNTKQNSTDNNLDTTNKTITGAINELLTKVQELETKNTELESRLAALEGTN